MDTTGAGAVVVGIDGSDGSRHALRWAVREARLHDLPLRLVVAGHLPPPAAEGGGRADGAGPAVNPLAAVIGDLVGDRPAEVRTVDAPAPVALLHELDHGGAVLVLGARGVGGFRALLLGSVSEHCARHATRPVVVVPAGAPTTADGPVVVGVDGSEGAAVALAWAIDEAAARQAPLEVVRSWWDPAWAVAWGYPGVPVHDPQADCEALLREEVEAALDRARQRPPAVSLVATAEPAATALLGRAATADLLVVGSRGRGGFAGLLLGSVSQHCIRHAPCATAVIRR